MQNKENENALNEQPAQGVPDGYVLVPIEPTAKTLKAMCFAGTDGKQTQAECARMRLAYSAMIAAVPAKDGQNG